MKKKIMVCVDLSNLSVDLFKKDLRDWSWDGIEEVHFVHGFQLQHYADAFCYSYYPTKEQEEGVEDSVKEVLAPLENIVKELAPGVKTYKKCLIVGAPKDAICDYAEEKKIDRMVIGTRGIHGVAGIFSSSFAEYMVRHAPCELRIIRESQDL